MAEQLILETEELDNGTPEEDIQTLRELLKKETSIYFAERKDVLIRYLRAKKLDPQEALELMKKVAEFKEKHQDLIGNITPANLKTNCSTIRILKKRDEEKRRILIFQGGAAWDTSKIRHDECFRILYLFTQALSMEPATQINGVVIIFDYNGLGMEQIKESTPEFTFRLLTYIQDAMPLRLEGFHIVNQPLLFNVIWTIFKPLIKEELDKVLELHGTNMESLHKHVVPNDLPSDYGGNLPEIKYSTYSTQEWLEKGIRPYNSLFEENNTFGFKENMDEQNIQSQPTNTKILEIN